MKVSLGYLIPDICIGLYSQQFSGNFTEEMAERSLTFLFIVPLERRRVDGEVRGGEGGERRGRRRREQKERKEERK